MKHLHVVISILHCTCALLVDFSSFNMYPNFQPFDEQVDQIPNTTVTREQVNDEALCSVCYEDFTLGETVLQLPCKHCFHSNCVITWIRSRRKNTCPYCNSVIFAPPPWFIRLKSAITRRINQDCTYLLLE